MAINIKSQLSKAEDFLHLGAGDKARDAASSVLLSTASPSEVSRALFVLLQADYQDSRCVMARVCLQ